eukprot:m.261534 g.261534  ORF g.261534 m.261534 type:complete len:55 (+) comp86409_c0_seq1:126-290(+)
MKKQAVKVQQVRLSSTKQHRLLTHGLLLKTLGAVNNLVSKKKITTWTVLLLKAG